jgi:hypothetical protein
MNMMIGTHVSMNADDDVDDGGGDDGDDDDIMGARVGRIIKNGSWA